MILQQVTTPSFARPAQATEAPPPETPAEPKEKFSPTRAAAGALLTFMGRRIPTTVPEITREKADELKSKLQPGDVIMTADCAYPGWARMEFWTVRSNYTHAAYYAGDGKILEAVGKGVIETKLDDYFEGRQKIAIVRPDYKTPEDVAAATAYCRSHLGKPYDSVFNSADDKEFYCSELVFKALKSMPNPIEAPSKELLGREAVAPDAFLRIPGIQTIHDDKSNYWTNKLGHWPIAAATVGLGAAGASIGGWPGAAVGAGVGMVGTILGWNKLQTGYFLPSFEDFRGGKQ
ncbi:MAG: hypothetical protein AMXMBFR33_55060 [Candidatus Xenobia bacterium]